MNDERFTSVDRLLGAALEREPHERAAFLREACPDDEALRRDVESLLAHDSGAAGFLSTPAFADGMPGSGASFVGRHVGSYTIQAPLGAGGMGEVYRARDSKLGREVAIKILPRLFTRDPDRLARFDREARLLASLNHPHIGAIYGLEDMDGMPALVLELVEGDTLADRLAHEPIPISEALQIARQIADALDAAHEKGIIHRDLKPANIKITPEGVVKVLDFGLARAVGPPEGGPHADLSQSPTIFSGGTREGMILGTAAYMSPEQARGKPVDKRTDIWAFGCVLYEMLTGSAPFARDTLTDTLAAVVEREPDWQALPPATPDKVRDVLRRCLHKNPHRRLRDIGDARLEIDDAIAAPTPAAVGAASVRNTRKPLLAAIVSGALIGTLLWFFVRPGDSMPPRVSRLAITPTRAAALTISGNDRDLAITPDGSRVVYVGNRGTQLFVRALDAIEPVVVFTGTPRGPFVSPDGQWIGFADNNNLLKRVAITGGPAVTLTTIDGPGARGATWGPDDNIIFAGNGIEIGLQQVAAAGGPATVLTRPDRAQGEFDHIWPERLPGGRAVLFTIAALTGGLDAARIALLDLQTGTRRTIVHGGSHAHYLPSGHLVYAAGGTLRAVPFDLARLETRGTSVPVVPDVVTTTFGAVDAVVAGDGTLAYVLGGSVAAVGPQRTLVWVDREGRATPIPQPPRAYANPRLSPDGTRIAVHVQDQERDLWISDLRRATFTRATFDPGADGLPVWTHDGRWLIFGSARTPTGVSNLFRQPANRTGVVEQLTDSPNPQGATAVSPDGRWLIFTETSPKTRDDVMQMALDGTRRVTPLVDSPFAELNGVVSPDGHWLAYQANDSGPFEIYVRPFPAVNSGFSQVSAAGGTQPLWTRSGQELELVYVAPTGALMRVGVERGSSWASTTPTPLVKDDYLTRPGGNFGPTYDIARDGRFLMIKDGDGSDASAAPGSLIIVQHWVEELKGLLPTP